jgi:hypothetical protein
MIVGAAASVWCAAGAGAGSCLGDLNGDNEIDGADLGLLLTVWDTFDPQADLNGDQTVNGADLGLMLANWGSCGVQVVNVMPPVAGAGQQIVIEGSFPSDDPYDFCVNITETGQEGVAGDVGEPLVVMFAPIAVLDILEKGGKQFMIAQLGPVPEGFEGEVMLNIVPGEGNPVDLVNFHPDLIDLNDAGACWGDPQPGGAHIIFNVGQGVGGTDCGPLYDRSYVGTAAGGILCVTLAPGPLAGGAYPAGTKFSIWPRFHTCDGQYVSDFGTIEFTLAANATVGGVAGLIEFYINQEVETCGKQNGLIPDTDSDPVGPLSGPWTICMSIAGHDFCAGNLVICVDLP